MNYYSLNEKNVPFSSWRGISGIHGIPLNLQLAGSTRSPRPAITEMSKSSVSKMPQDYGFIVIMMTVVNGLTYSHAEKTRTAENLQSGPCA